jgi:hypothetical protein
MKEDPEKPIRYGICPVGPVYLGFVVMVGIASLGPLLLKLVQWILRYLDQGN